MLISKNITCVGQKLLARPQWQVQGAKQSLTTSHIRAKIFGPPDPEGRPPPRKNFKESLLPPEWLKLVEKYPDFLPDPLDNNPLHVSRQIDDMLKRRCVIEIPEFYVGTIMSVTASDTYSDTKKSKFMGICIQRTGRLLSSNFTIRNVIDGMGVEIRYDMYNPRILSIEVLKLQKRLDDELLYLRDALPEYSTFPEDMKPEIIDEGSEVSLDRTLVNMKPLPWSRRWERYLYKGIEKMENIPQIWAERRKLIENDNVNNYDTLSEYKLHCTEEMLYNICKRLADHEKNVVQVRKEARERRFLRMTKAPPLTTNGSVEAQEQ